MDEKVMEYLDMLRKTRNIYMAVEDNATIEDIKKSVEIIDAKLTELKISPKGI